jgi:hypothetical protein
MMTETPGDGDASYLAFPHVRTLLDIGLTTQQVETLYEQYRDEAIAPLFRYALAVRQARSHHYGEALELSEGLDLTEMPAEILASYYRNYSWFSSYNRQAEIQIEMQQMLTEQRQRWQQLQQLQEQAAGKMATWQCGISGAQAICPQEAGEMSTANGFGFATLTCGRSMPCKTAIGRQARMRSPSLSIKTC